MSTITAPAFHGETYSEARDGARLGKQQAAVNALMKDGVWRDLESIEDELAAVYPQASISARLRSARQPKHGGWDVQRRYLKRGHFEYRFVPSSASPMPTLQS